MTKEAIKKFMADVGSALDAYFNAVADPQGRSDSEAVYDIVEHHAKNLVLLNKKDFMSEDDIESRIGVVDTDEGLNVAYEFGTHFDLGMLESLDPVARIELLEACIYALNTRITELETDIKKRINERREGK
jgi:hypothetical protein